MLALLRWLFGAELRALRAQLLELQRAEQERERVVREQLDQLRRYWKREQTRAARANGTDDDPDDGLDPISRAILARRRAVMPRNAEGPQ